MTTALSAHFTLDELTASSTAIRRGIDQTPPPAVLKNLTRTASQMELVRTLLGGKPIRVNSGYRSPALNKAVGGAAGSAHLTGHAVDFVCPDFGTPKEVAQMLAACPILTFDQIIQEGTWVHISFDPAARREILTAHFGGGTVTYSKGLK
jgi:hypothetical protein